MKQNIRQTAQYVLKMRSHLVLIYVQLYLQAALRL